MHNTSTTIQLLLYHRIVFEFDTIRFGRRNLTEWNLNLSKMNESRTRIDGRSNRFTDHGCFDLI